VEEEGSIGMTLGLTMTNLRLEKTENKNKSETATD
jgi:hypothetical protein